MLTHANMFYQIQNLSHYIRPDVGDSSLSLLPPWHIYERACGYYLYYSGCTQVSGREASQKHQSGWYIEILLLDAVTEL